MRGLVGYEGVPECWSARGYAMDRGPTLRVVGRCLTGRNRLSQSHVGEVGLSAGQEGFVWIFEIADNVKLTRNISLKGRCCHE